MGCGNLTAAKYWRISILRKTQLLGQIRALGSDMRHTQEPAISVAPERAGRGEREFAVLPQRPTPVLAPIYPKAMPAAIVSHAGPGEPRRASLSGAAVRAPNLGRQRQLGVYGDIGDIAVVADETDPAVAPLEPHDVARLRISAVFEDRDHLPTLEPGRGERYAIDLGVQCKEQTDIRTADAKRMQRLMELDVVGQQRPQAVPVSLVEQRDITRHRIGRRPGVRKRAAMRVDLSKMRATPRRMAFHRVNREVEEGSDLYQRLVEHVLQDDDTALEGGELDKARHCGFNRVLAHQHLQGVRLGRVGNVRGGVDRFGHAHLPASEQVERAVMSNPEQPGAKRGAPVP